MVELPLTVTVPPAALKSAAAKKMIERFTREFADRFATSKNPDSVYCCAVQFFNLQKEELR